MVRCDLLPNRQPLGCCSRKRKCARRMIFATLQPKCVLVIACLSNARAPTADHACQRFVELTAATAAEERNKDGTCLPKASNLQPQRRWYAWPANLKVGKIGVNWKSPLSLQMRSRMCARQSPNATSWLVPLGQTPDSHSPGLRVPLDECKTDGSYL
jgi:hypothetical protein